MFAFRSQFRTSIALEKGSFFVPFTSFESSSVRSHRGLILAWVCLIGVSVVGQLNAQSVLNSRHVEFLTNHCSDCHQGENSEGGFDLEKLTTAINQEEQFFKWERVFDRLTMGEMPPEDYDQPDAKLKQQFLKSLKLNLTAVHKQQKSTVLRRLNRKEYQNTLNDLFGTDLKLAELLPEDGRSHEFDNVGSALNISMVHLKQYMEAARLVLDEAIAKTASRPKAQRIEGSYASSREGDQFIGKVWKKLPDGAVVRFSGGGYPTGMIRSTNVRKAGRYRVKVTGYAYQTKDPITFSVGGTTFKRGAEKPTYGFYTFKPGKPQSIEFETRIDSNYMIQIEPFGINDPDRYKRQKIEGYDGAGLAILSVVLDGPLLDDFPSLGHQLVFDGIKRVEIEPSNPRLKEKSWYRPEFKVQSSDETADAFASLRRVAAFAFRRKVKDADVAPFTQLYLKGRKDGLGFEPALRQAITALLCSPSFLFLQETEGELDDFALASRLSYFLHRTMPDKTLLAAASARQLREVAELRSQVSRMMTDHRFDRFITDFADSWLNLREMDFTIPDASLFPEFDQYLRFSMPLETKAFLKEMFRSNLPVKNLVSSDFAMLNQRLAAHYGIENVVGTEIRKVKLPADSVRGGLLSQASILKVSANGTNTSPVVRGVWVLERILGESPLPPPPGVPGVEPDIRGATTLREQLDKHRNLTQCQSCHRSIDPPGFALELFNPIGGYRERYRSMGQGDRVNTLVNGRKVRYRLGPAVDGSGRLKTGEAFQDFQEFRKILAQNEKQIAKAFAEKLLVFGTGRELGFSDREEVEQIVESTAKRGYRTRDLLEALVTSKIFLSK